MVAVVKRTAMSLLTRRHVCVNQQPAKAHFAQGNTNCGCLVWGWPANCSHLVRKLAGDRSTKPCASVLAAPLLLALQPKEIPITPSRYDTWELRSIAPRWVRHTHSQGRLPFLGVCTFGPSRSSHADIEDLSARPSAGPGATHGRNEDACVQPGVRQGHVSRCPRPVFLYYLSRACSRRITVNHC